MSLALDGFLPYITPEVLGCPEPLVSRTLLLTASDFCRRTLSWTELQAAIPLVGDQRDYTVTYPADSYLVAVKEVWLGARQLVPKRLTDVGGWNTGQTGDPLYFNMAADRASVSVFPTPSMVTAASLLYVRAAYAPTPIATTLPDFLWTDHLEVIASGVKAKLMAMPGTAWSNLALGAYHQGLFDAGALDARIDELHDRVPTSITVTPRTFGF